MSRIDLKKDEEDSAVVLRAAEQFADLLGAKPGSVSSIRARKEGWVADVEIALTERCPRTTSIKATYSVTLNSRGELRSYRRTRRYTPGEGI
ncbi:gas vesicle protein [Streptomyces sp. A7024]|uniref:Gas vesicle protein n=1 Tax=Streptomyces coryli TaxID=1128680 RepID=A0A6G4UC69_9ACTN|nr:gas vesicle protein GvpO [Streptomyces coryli]NGN68978.1 gas vesicle protein [Streptomyces coryli]